MAGPPGPVGVPVGLNVAPPPPAKIERFEAGVSGVVSFRTPR
jgi:hypothetical protein